MGQYSANLHINYRKMFFYCTIYCCLKVPGFITFSHFQDGVLVKFGTLNILRLQRPHLREAILCDVDHWVVESVLESPGGKYDHQTQRVSLSDILRRDRLGYICHLAAFQRCRAQTNGL